MGLRSNKKNEVCRGGTCCPDSFRAPYLFRSLVFLLLVCFFAIGTCSKAEAGNGVPAHVRTQALAASSAQPAGPDQANGAAAVAAEAAASITKPAALPETDYVLGIGDRIRLTVYGEDDLSGEYEVNRTGVMALPLIGAIKATGTTLREFEEAVRLKLKAGYLNDPRVSVQVTNYRPFFILGEVSKPGSYPYVNGMSVLNAVALAGGYTYRADGDGVTIMHAADPEKKEQRAREDAVVMPGDIVRVPERLF